MGVCYEVLCPACTRAVTDNLRGCAEHVQLLGALRGDSDSRAQAVVDATATLVTRIKAEVATLKAAQA
jgi:hypothetical protein